MSDVNRRFVLGGGAIAATALAAACSPQTPKSSSTTPAAATVSNKQSDIIVIGAGLSGLNATLLLEEMGYSVTLLEGRDRVGGRLYTLDDVPGYPEAGGSGIGSSYGRLLGAIDKYDIPLVSERKRTVPVPEISMMNIGGEHIRFNEWGKHNLNPMPDEYKDMLPWYVQYSLFAKDNPLTSAEQFVDPKFAAHDISTYQYFKSKGFNERAIKLAAGTNMSYGDENGPHGLSTLMMYNILAFARSVSGIKREGSPFASKGGNQRIPEMMSNGLKTDIQFNAKVAGIRNEKDHAEVHLSTGQILKAKRVIVTIPFSALRLVDMDIPFGPGQARAIQTLGYTNVTHLHYVPTRKFWEEDQMPPSMWTDGPTARFRVANHLDRLGAEQSNRYILNYLNQIRPSTKGALKFVKYWSWQLDPFSGGAYAAWKPGQLTSFGKDMSLPAGRVHFAGEHTAVATRGMEGAMESGERVAFEVADLI